ncbi:MAG: hypothetical protein KGL35_28905 [Bradyrhizobium sp.]|uniref:hypothetical protein n=1 Tax=Bradyrhizobium sp. TaxID=376 RepID=UPI001C2A1AAD|nr:hypothetical protein [Bradyrhizobium sp.]MBU6461122.1 hypothetical protein [Pseudomonadota bacterium]MDE2066198.1 hypothetical protein [Bradyrhizobium sp.]MDE2472638.1 hypothetical protein [Bradyrhizobium sp.]
MIRCQEKPGLQVLLVLVKPFPPRAKRDVVAAFHSTQSVLHAEASPNGTALVLPIEAAALTSSLGPGPNEFTVSVKDPEVDIHGVIPLDGLAPALAKLSASCPPPG